MRHDHGTVHGKTSNGVDPVGSGCEKVCRWLALPLKMATDLLTYQADVLT